MPNSINDALFSMTADINGRTGFGIKFSNNNQNTDLATGVAQTFTVPGDSFSEWEAIFSYEPGSRVWVAYNTTATVPGGSVANTASCLLPCVRTVRGGDTISCITPDASAEVGISYYAL